MNFLIILMLFFSVISCKRQTPNFENNKAITNTITFKDGCSSISVYEIELLDGTKCVLLSDKEITCAWNK